MTARRPLVLLPGGKRSQLPAGDTLAPETLGDIGALIRPFTQLTPVSRSLAILGDSIVAQCSDPTVGTENYGFLSNALRAADQRFTFDLAHNFGVGGDTSTQAIVRVPDVIAAGVGTCIVAVGTNDRTSAMTADQTMVNLLSARDSLNAAGIYVIMMTPAPRGDSAFPDKTLTGAQLGYHLEVRRRILTEARGPGCSVVDLWPTLADPASTTGGIRLGYTRDGLHPLTNGAYYWGKPLAAVMCSVLDRDVSLLPNSNSAVWTATNPTGIATTNPMVLGSGGVPAAGGSGVMADGWGGTNAGAAAGVTRVYSKVTTPTGDWQQIVVGGTAPTALAAVDLMRQIGLQGNVVAGQYYEGVGEFEIDTGTANFLSLQLGVVATLADTTTVTLWDGDRYLEGSVMAGEAQAGTFRTPRLLIPAGVTDVRLRLACYLGVTGAPVATIRVRKLAMIQAKAAKSQARADSYDAEVKALFNGLASAQAALAVAQAALTKLQGNPAPGYDKKTVVAAATGTVTLDLSSGATIFQLTLTGNTTIVWGNIPVIPAGQEFNFIVRLISTGTKYTITWPTSMALTWMNTTSGAAGGTPAINKTLEHSFSTSNGTTAYARKGSETL